MHEKLLHYIWQSDFLLNQETTTIQGETLKILSQGEVNHNSGPDFLNCQIQIDAQKWAGNLEIHLKSSDWYAHQHEKDPAYDNVILHVVWEHDAEIYRLDGSIIPTLELKQVSPKKLVERYKKLINTKPIFIKCENHFNQIDQLKINSFLERIYFERLEVKYQSVQEILKQNHNDWEATLFKFVLKYFGLNINGDAFLTIGNSIEFPIFRKFFEEVLILEAILFGQAGLLEGDHTGAYFNELRLVYLYQKSKYSFTREGIIPPKFFRLRPINFPTIRLSQFANLYAKNSKLFSEILEATSINEVYKIFSITTSPYWKNHYNFDKQTYSKEKKLSIKFIDLLLLNAIVPVKFAYFKSHGKTSEIESLIELARKIPVEKNKIVESYFKIRPTLEKNSVTSQALIQLKRTYCEQNRCIECVVGCYFLKDTA